MIKNTYYISGTIQMAFDYQAIVLEKKEVEAVSQRQALFKLALILAKQEHLNTRYIYERIKRSKLHILKGGH